MPLGHVWLLWFRNLGRQIHLVVQNNINRWISDQSHVLLICFSSTFLDIHGDDDVGENLKIAVWALIESLA